MATDQEPMPIQTDAFTQTSGDGLSPITRPAPLPLDSASDSDGGIVPAPLTPASPGPARPSKRGGRKRSRSRNRTGTAGSYASGMGYFPSDQASTRGLAPSDEYDDDYRSDYTRHPDRPPRRSLSRPPRSYLNHPAYAGGPESPAKMYIEETKTPREFVVHADPRRQYDEEYGYGNQASIMGGALPLGRTATVASRFSPDGQPPRIMWKDLTRDERNEVLRIPWTQWMNSEFKNHFVAMLGEFIGTTMFLVFAFAGAEVASIGRVSSSGFNISSQFYIAVSFGFSLLVNVWIFFRISGAQFNPAVTLAMVLVGAINVVRALCLFVAQILGSMFASLIVRYLFPQPFSVRTTLGNGTNLLQGVFIEAILTSELVFTILMLAKEKHRATFMAPIGIGLALFIAHLVGVPYTGASLNPARSFGPCVVSTTFESEHWIYWVGPAFGALIAVVFYKMIKVLEYEMANPGADGDAENDPTQNPLKKAELEANRRFARGFDDKR